MNTPNENILPDELAKAARNLEERFQILRLPVFKIPQADWQVDNPDICLTYGPVPTANFPIVINIPPGGEYTNEMGAAICKPISAKTLTFRMGFTPRGDKQTFWSNKVLIKIIP